MKSPIPALVRQLQMPIHYRLAGFLVLMLGAATLPAKTLTWQSTSSTAWETAANWYDEGASGTSSTAPTSADAVTINSTRSATAQPSVTVAGQAAKSLVVGSGFTLTISGANGGLQVGDGLAANNDITIQSGGEIINSGTSATATFSVVSTSNDRFRIDSGGRFVHNTTRSYTTPFPTAVQNFDANSTFVFRGASGLSTTVVFSGRTFGNLTIESSSGAYSVTAATGTGAATINGSLSVGATGAGTVTWTLAAGTTSPYNIAGNLNIGSGSTITFPEIPITLNGNLTNNGTMTINGTSGIFTFNGTAATVAGSTTSAFGGGFAINSGKAVTLAQGIIIASGKTGTVNGALNCGTSTVSGAGNFTLTSGATLGVGSATGVNGNITVSGTKTLDTAANYTFNGTAAQTTAGLPTTVNNLTITNALVVSSGGVTLFTNVTVSGQLALTAGRLITSSNLVIIADAAVINPTNGGSGSYVDGNLQKVWAATGTKSFVFPVGTGATFAPCSVTNLVLSAAGNLTASTTNVEHGNIGSSTIDPTKDANRYWTMTAGGGLAVSTYSASCTFLGGDLDGGANSANFVMEKWNGSTWTRAASSSVAGSTVTGNGFTSFGDFVVGESAAVSTSPAGVGAASPATVGRGNTTLLTVTVTPGTFPNSTGLAVTADLSAIGGSAAQQFYDDNTHGDATGGDNVFSYLATITTGTPIGAKSLSTVVTDAQLRTNISAIISVTVAGVARTWSGGGGDDSFGTAANWSTGVAPISPADSVIFTGSTRLAPSLDSSATVPGLLFDSSAGSFILGATGGSALTLNGGTGLTNNSANPETVNIPVILGSAQTFNASGAGTLTLSNTVDNGGNLLTGDGANNSVFTAAISGGGGLTKNGSGTMTLAGNNSYGGATTVNAGTLAVAGGSAIPDASAVTLANVAGATLTVNANETIGSLAGGGATGGTVALGANNLSAGGTTTYSGAVTGTGRLVKTGSGTLTLNNAGAIGSSFTLRVEGGMVDLNRGGGSLTSIIGSGNTIELAGGTNQLTASVQANFALTFGALNVAGDSTFSFNRNGTSSPTSPTITAPLNFTGNANLSFIYNAQISSGTTTFNGAANTLQGNGTLTLGAYTVTIANAIGESGGSHSLSKAGPGQLILNAINTYSGDTTNLAGSVSLNGTSTFGNGAGRLVLGGGDVLVTSSRAGAPIANPLYVIANTSTIYGDSTATAPSTRIVPFSGALGGSGGTLRIGNKGLANNTFQVRLTAGGFTLNQPVIVGDSGFDTAGAISLLQLDNDNTTGNQVFTGTISGSGSVLRDAPASGTGGTTILGGASTFSGGTTIAGGFIGFGTNSISVGGVVTSGPVGMGTLEIDNDPSVGIFASGGARTVENNIFLNAVPNVQINGTDDLTLAGLFRVGGVAKTLTINNAGVTTLSGVVTNAAPLTKAGSGKLILSGTNVNTGSFTIGTGTLALVGNGSIASSPAVNIAAGAVFDVSGLNSTFALGGSQTLSNSASATGIVNGNMNTGTGTVSVSYASGTPSFNVTNGQITLSASTVFKVDNTGSSLAVGSYKLISKTTTGNTGVVGGVVPTSVTVGGAGAAAAVTLQIISGELYLVVNHPPVANPNTYTRNGLNTWKIAITNLLANATDADGDTLSLAGVGVSTNGVTLVIGGGYVQYYNANLVNDQFSYTVADGNGGTGSAVITLTAGSASGVGGQVNNFTLNGGTASMSFAGIPGYLYHVQVSTNLTDWNTVWSTNAPSGGVFQFSDGAAPQPDAYYRLMWNGN